jgi:hypothetical protein
MSLWSQRAAEMAATFMIGDGLLGLLQPRRHVALWERDAAGAELVVAPFRGRPGRRRLYALLQIGAGLALAARQRAA